VQLGVERPKLGGEPFLGGLALLLVVGSALRYRQLG